MADDLGLGWVDYDGSNAIVHTPNLERMAKSGMVFTRAYAAAPVCSPTRASCISGMSPAQVGYTTHAPGMGVEKYLNTIGGRGQGGAVDADSRTFLAPDTRSYARELQDLGYATAFMGKWHLAGGGRGRGPEGVVTGDWYPDRYGFDINLGGCAFGGPRSWFSPYRNPTLADGVPGEYLTDRLGDEAAAFIHTHRDRAFHLTLWLYSVHTPHRAPDDLVARNEGNGGHPRRGAYRAMIESTDLAVGKVLDALEDVGVADNTLVVFYSDNGGHVPTPGLAEMKGSLLEGGIRVPMVVTWPGVTSPGTSCPVPVTSVDFFPTFVHAAGGSTDGQATLEGADLKPLLEGAQDLGRDALYWHFPHHRNKIEYAMGSAILKQGWKFYQGYGETGDALFNLDADPGETRNVISEHPEQVNELRVQLNAWLERVDAKMPRADSDF